MSLRAQPPVRSPLTLRAITAGLGATIRGGAGPLQQVAEVISTRFHPAALALTDSGTTALGLALRLAAARRPGRPVLLPAWGCYDLATAADFADARVACYDLDPDTLGPDWDSLARALQLEPAAAVGVPFFGVAIDWPKFAALVTSAGAVPIEDAAQGAGGTSGGRPLGGMGDLAILSFGRGKGVTGGSGGALLAHDSVWAAAVGALELSAGRGGIRDVFALGAQWILTRPSLYGLPAGLPWLGLGQTVYHPPHPAEGLSAFAAGTLSITLDLAAAEAAARRRNAQVLLERLAGTRARLVTPPAGTEAGWLRMPVILPGEANASVAGDSRARSLGIYPGYPKTLGELPGFRRRVTALEVAMPGARVLAHELVTLPTHGGVRRSDLERLVQWVRDVGYA